MKTRYLTLFLVPLLLLGACKPVEETKKPKPTPSVTAPVPAPKSMVFPVKPGSVPDPFEPDPGREWEGVRAAAISAWVEPEYGPMKLTISAVDLDTGQAINLIDAPDEFGMVIPAGSQFRLMVAWPERHRVELTMHATAVKPGSQKGYLAARTIDRRPGRKTSTFSGLAACNLQTVFE